MLMEHGDGHGSRSRRKAHAEDRDPEQIEPTLFIFGQEQRKLIAPCSNDHDESRQGDKDLKGSKVARAVDTRQDWRCGNRNRLRHGRSTHQDRDASGESAGWQPSVTECREYLLHKHAGTAEKKIKWTELIRNLMFLVFF